MDKKHRKLLLLAGKIVLAITLLAWVLSKAHWRDYVRTRDGQQTFAVVEIRYDEQGQVRTVRIARGMLWWETREDRPVGEFARDPGAGGLVHRGFAWTIRNLDKLLLAAAMGGFLLSFLILSCRLWFLLRIQEIRIGLWEAVRLTFVGLFFNAVVPGTVGGDLVKAYYVCKHTDRKAAVLVTIFVDRVLGLTELVLLAAVMIGVVWIGGMADSFERIRTAAISVTVVMGIVICTLVFLFSPRVRRMVHLQKLYQRFPIAHHIAAAGDAATLYRRRMGKLVEAVGMTFGAHVVWVGALVLLGMSLGLTSLGPDDQIPWYDYFVYVPLIYIIGAVPITPGGVGLLEKLYLLYFASANASMVLALALLARFIPIFWSLPGAVVAVTGPKLPPADAMEAELGIDEDAEAQQ